MAESFVKTISHVKALPTDTIMKDMLKVKVVDCSQATGYTTSKGQPGSLFNCTIADASGAVRAVVYDGAKLPSFKKDSVIILVDVIVKDGFIAITKQTQVWPQNGTIELPQEVEEQARSVLCGEAKTVDIVTAATSPKKEVIGQLSGRIYMVGKLESRTTRSNKESILFRKCKLLDTTGKISVCLWRDMASTEFKKGDNVCLHNFSVTDTFDKQHKTVPAVTNRLQSSSIEFLPQSDELELEDTSSDEDSTPVGTVESINELTSYRSCRNSACYNRKLNNLRCATCGMMYRESGVGTSYIGKLLMITTTGPRCLTFFTQQLEMLKNQLEIQGENPSELQVQLRIKCPFRCSFETRGDKLIKIQKIQGN